MPKTTPREEAALKKLDSNGASFHYVACDLTVQQKLSLDVFIEQTDLEDLHKWLSKTVLANHSISIKVLPIGFQCSVTGSKGSNAHENVSLISRSSSPERALWSAMFKDVEILHGVWPVTNRLEDLD